MSLHSSLSSSLKDKQQKSVLKRIERIKFLMDKGLFKEGSSVFGLPKIKSAKIKIKKEKAEEKVQPAAGAVGAAGTAEAAASAPAKSGAPQAAKSAKGLKAPPAKPAAK